MKVITLLLLIFVSITSAQNKVFDMPSINVSGSSFYEIKPESYKLNFTLSIKDTQYAGIKFDNIEEMKQEFLKKLQKENIKPEKITENKLDYNLIGNKDPGSTFEIIVSNQKTFEDLMAFVFPGTYINNIQFKVTFLGKSYDQIISEALSNAKQKASQIANLAGKKVGNILSIQAYHLPKEHEWSYYNIDKTYTINVSYELLEK
tara:strand:- start:16422 stop:17033 length:612 start_codon:yes stop_codon:yes gene_type:complete